MCDKCVYTFAIVVLRVSRVYGHGSLKVVSKAYRLQGEPGLSIYVYWYVYTPIYISK